jgi:hypothetical protein
MEEFNVLARGTVNRSGTESWQRKILTASAVGKKTGSDKTLRCLGQGPTFPPHKSTIFSHPPREYQGLPFVESPFSPRKVFKEFDLGAGSIGNFFLITI